VFAIATVAAITGAHWLAYETLSLLTAPGRLATRGVGALAAAAIAVILVLAAWVHGQRFRPHAQGTAPIVAAICAVLYSVDLASLAIHKVLPSPWGLPLFLVLLVGGVLLATQLREKLLRVRALRIYRWEDHSEALKRAEALVPPWVLWPARSATHMIVLYSTPSIVPAVAEDVVTFHGKTGDPVMLNRGMTIRAAIDALGPPRPNWQHLLRGLEPHVDTLKSVTLIGSKPRSSETSLRKASPGVLESPEHGSHGSMLYADECVALLKLFLPCAKVQIHSVAADFEDVEQLFSLLLEEIRVIHQHNDHADIVIETTGAMKSTSIAGAVATVNPLGAKTMFQYVGTNEPYTVFLHDLRLEGPPEV